MDSLPPGDSKMEGYKKSWGVKQCSLVDGTSVSDEYSASVFRVEDVGSRFLL